VKTGVGCFVLGVAAGVLGTLLYFRLQSEESAEQPEELAERLGEHVAELESRMKSILGEPDS
jgi:hypothetical protein